MKTFFIAILFFLVATQTVFAATYYLSATGDDEAAGTSDSTPWKTFNKINEYAESPGFEDGDSILLKRGDRWDSSVCSEDLGWDKSAVNWGDNKTITIGAYGKGNRPIIDGDDVHVFLSDDNGSNGFNISFVIQDIEMQGGSAATVQDPAGGFAVMGLYNITFDGVKYDGWEKSPGTAHVFGIAGARIKNNVTIQNCDLRNAIYKPCGAIGCYSKWLGKDNNLVRFSYNVEGGKTQGKLLIQNCYFDQAEGDAIQMKDHNGYPTTDAHEIKNCYFGAVGENPIDFKSTWGRIHHNEFASGDIRAGSSGTNGGIACFHNSRHYGLQPHDLEIDHNYFHDWAGDAFWVNNVDRTLFHHNYLKNLIGIAEIAKSDDVEIYNNILVNNTKTTSTYLKLLAVMRWYNGGTGNKIFNNSIFIPNGGLAYGIHVEDGIQVDVTNNILQTADADVPLLHWINSSTGTVTHNQYYGPGALISWNGVPYSSGNFPSWAAEHTGDEYGDPQFVDPAGGNLSLSDDSPAIDTGTILDADYDDAIIWETSEFDSEEGPPPTVNTKDQDDDTDWDRGAIIGEFSGGDNDTAPPVVSDFSPAATLPEDTAQTTVSVTTDEAATCLHNETGGLAYDDADQTEFTTTGGTTHSYTKTGLSPGTSTDIFIRCADAAGNANTTDFVGTVNVGTAGNLLSADKILNEYSSTNVHSDYPLSHATDQDFDLPTGSVGGDGIDTVVITYDLGKDYNLTSTKIYGDDTKNWYCDTWQVETSDDLVNWNTEFTGQDCFGLDWFPQPLSASGRYVRYTITGNTAYHAVQFVELWLEGTPIVGPTDNLLSADKILNEYSSTNVHSNYPLSHATDQDFDLPTGSVGGNGIDTVVITYDLGENYNLTSTKIYGDDTNNWYCDTWQVETSDDLVNWNTEFTGQDCFGLDWFPQPLSASGRYVRYTITGNTAYHAVQFVELWLEGTPQ
jgi:hypothetical protein